MQVRPGSPFPLGATWDGRGTNFAIFSANAEKIELCLFDRAGRRELERIVLPEVTDDVWHVYLPEVVPGQVYGYRVYGPYEPERGHRFNHHKLLLDPYAKRLIGNFVWSDAHFAYRTRSARADLSFDKRDNSRSMYKCVVVDDAFTWGDDRSPRTPWHETIIYEAHVRGLTMQRKDIVPAWRGNFRGLGSPQMIEHLQRLGVTAIELLPIHAHIDEHMLVEKGLRNYWGYSTVGYFAPEPHFGSADAALEDFKATVAQLHLAGIEVILDVVYNHTCEGNHLGPTFAFRGIDNASYYWLKPGAPRYYDDFTGCGNSLNLTHPRVLQMVMDSLRYWVEKCHVDGFRFDLATTLGRGPTGFDPNSGFFCAVSQDPVLAQVKLIAEPWDVGWGGYQLGAFPQGWSEWNDAFRRTLRSFWRGDHNQIRELAARMAGSADRFRHHRRLPRTSVNHITVHDGFTLADLVSYAHKHNAANGEDNRDGSDDNQSTNWGVEGPTNDKDVIEARRRAKRGILASLFLAYGVPLMLAGDEVGNSQNGNNNAYCQDNEIGWVDWPAGGRKNDDLTDLVTQLTALRRSFPQLQGQRWLIGHRGGGHYDVKWITPLGTEMTEADWAVTEACFLSYVLAPLEPSGVPLFIVLNAAPEPAEVVLPKWPGCNSWARILGTVVDNSEPGDFKIKIGTQACGAGPIGYGLRRNVMTASPLFSPGLFGPRLDSKGITFRLWAPAATSVDLVTTEAQPMRRHDDGWFDLRVPGLGAGARYKFRIDEEVDVPDPASSFQPDDVNGASEVIDHAYAWAARDWRGRPWHEAVILELHVGSFTPEGTYRAAIARLDDIVAAGFTAIELMPLADFYGRRNWGYDGVLLYAPDSSYGRPDDLRALIDAAHQRGLMVFLDVVYNHFGPEGNYLGRYAPQFFTDAFHTPWGSAIDYGVPQVRAFAIENALHWVANYRFDGLRLDAVHAILQRGTPSILKDLSRAVGAFAEANGRMVHLVLENDDNAASLLDPAAPAAQGKYRAQWNDDFHHAWHVLLTEEGKSYYRDYIEAPRRYVVRTLVEGFAYQGEPSPHRGGIVRGECSTQLPPTAFVSFLQNHDQIGNRARGERLDKLAKDQRGIEAALAVMLLAPSPPLMFMGEEWGADQPFPFFCDFAGDLAEAVRNGRRKEFAEEYITGNPDEIPDPLAEETFRSAVLDWTAREKPVHKRRLALVTELLATRRAQIVPRLARGVKPGEASFTGPVLIARWPADGGRLELLANLSAASAPRPHASAGTPIWGGPPPADLPPWGVYWSWSPA